MVYICIYICVCVCVYIYIYIYEFYSAIINEWNCVICDNMDGPKGYYAKWNQSDRKRQMLYDFNYIWNVKNKTDKHSKTATVIDIENTYVVAREEEGEERKETGDAD